MLNNKFKKLILTSSLLAATGAANAGYEIKLSDKDSLTFGGFIKVDARYVDGDVAYRDAWYGAILSKGNGPDGAFDGTNKSQVNLNAKETRFNTKYVHGDVTGFLELDFTASGQGNEVGTNSYSPRLRQAYIKYQNLLVGQAWTTFGNGSAVPETIDFAGPAMGIVSIRQAQVRYTMGNFQVSVENPESWGGDPSIDDVPDFIAKYNFKGDWGNVSIAGLARKLHTTSGNSETGIGYSIAGRINTIGKDDFRFQAHGGNLGRYVGIFSARGLETKAGATEQEAEETTAFLVAYRHYWSEDVRSTVAYANAEADITGNETTQWSVNLYKNLTKQLAVGVEVGNYSRDDQDADSNYGALTLKYVL